jgi:hypothetical protein
MNNYYLARVKNFILQTLEVHNNTLESACTHRWIDYLFLDRYPGTFQIPFKLPDFLNPIHLGMDSKYSYFLIQKNKDELNKELCPRW